LLASCSGNEFSDLDTFMAGKKAQPGGFIALIPTFSTYEAFAYSAAVQRSPFDRPVEVREITQLRGVTALKPDNSRAKEFLEQFTFDSLLMVGTLKKGEQDWVLIQDPEGGVHRVQQGDYVGRNHGKIINTTDTYTAVIEIVSDGSPEGWVERPRAIKLSGL